MKHIYNPLSIAKDARNGMIVAAASTLKDLQGDPVPKSGGGFWDHKTSYDALKEVKNGIEGSLQNSNLDTNVRTFLELELGKADSYIQRIENLFNLFGGIG